MNAQSTMTGITVRLDTSFEFALERVTAALKAEGFGVLTEIDVKDTLKQKLDVDFRPYSILGACNPPLAYRALQAAPEVGMLLPCNVTISQEEGGKILVSIVDPIMLAEFAGEGRLEDIASEAKDRLTRVAESLSADR